MARREAVPSSSGASAPLTALRRKVVAQLFVVNELAAFEMARENPPIRVSADELVRMAFVHRVAWQAGPLSLGPKIGSRLFPALRCIRDPLDLADGGNLL